MPSRCRFSPTGKAATAPSSPRASTTETSVSSASRCSRTQATPPSARNAVGGILGPVHRCLPLAVIAQAAGLEQRGEAHLAHGGLQLALVAHRAERRGGKARSLEELLLADPVLGDGDGAHRGPHPARAREALQRLCRDVLEFRGDRGALGREAVERGGIGVGGSQVQVGRGAGGARRDRDRARRCGSPSCAPAARTSVPAVRRPARRRWRRAGSRALSGQLEVQHPAGLLPPQPVEPLRQLRVAAARARPPRRARRSARRPRRWRRWPPECRPASGRWRAASRGPGGACSGPARRGRGARSSRPACPAGAPRRRRPR